jgi:hypothetical protein
VVGLWRYFASLANHFCQLRDINIGAFYLGNETDL